MLNKNVVVATVVDWMSNELVRFEGANCADLAIQWREEEANKELTDEAMQGALEDLYVEGYDLQGNKQVIEFG